jgi:hypothetical protein
MASSTGEDSADYYSAIQNRIYDILGPILIVLGIAGAILSCSIFSQKSMRRNPCAIYFIAYSVSSFLSVSCGLVPPVLLYLFNFDPSTYNEPYCKIHFYMAIVPAILSPGYLVLAAIDRTLVTSAKALTRQRSTRRLAYWSIAGVTIVGSVYYTHLFVHVSIKQPFPGFYYCFYDSGIYTTFYIYSRLILNGFIPIFLMSLFAVITLKNIHRIGIQPVTSIRTGRNIQSLKNRQLAIILLAEIVVHVLFSLMEPIILIYTQNIQYQVTTTQQQALNQFLISVSFFLSYIPVSINFYVNMAISKRFRQTTIKILSKMCFRRPAQRNESQEALPAVNGNRSLPH